MRGWAWSRFPSSPLELLRRLHEAGGDGDDPDLVRASLPTINGIAGGPATLADAAARAVLQRRAAARIVIVVLC